MYGSPSARRGANKEGGGRNNLRNEIVPFINELIKLVEATVKALL